MENSPKRHLYSLGFWSSVIFALTGILYGASMGILLSKYSIPEYINLEQFISSIDEEFIDLYAFCQLFACASTVFFIIMLCTIHEWIEQRDKIFSKLSICFGMGFAILACLNYTIQFSIVRLSLKEGITQNLESFVQFNPRSFSSATNMLGWGLFLGLSTLFLAMLFKGKGINLGIRVSFYLTSLFCFIGFIGFTFDNQFFLLIFQMGMTIGLTIGAILLAFAFNRSKRENIIMNKKAMPF